MLRNISLNVKLAITIALIGVVVGGVNIYQITSVEHVNNLSKELVDSDAQRLIYLQNANFDNLDLRHTAADYQATVTDRGHTDKVDKATVTAKSDDLKKAVDSYKALTVGDIHAPSASKQAALYEYTDKVTQQTQVALDTTKETAFTDLYKSNEQLGSTIKDLTGEEQTSLTKEKAEISQSIGQVKTLFILMTLGVTTTSLLIGVVLSTSISRSISKLRGGALRIANGDFSVPLAESGKDEIGKLGQSFNVMSERLRESYKRLAIEQQRDEAILQGMGEGLIATDEKGNLLLINHKAAHYFGVKDQSSVLGQHIHDIYQLYDINEKDDKVLSDEKRPVFMALSTKATVHDVYAFHNTDGNRSLLDITATPIIFDGKVVGAISIMRDVTKEKEIDRMKTEFISLASHQLRTPLSAIKWFTEMLISGDAGKLTDEQQEFARNIDDSTERMIALVNALLNISRIESGRIIVDPKPTDLQELVTGIVNDLKAKTEERQQSLVISVHQGLPKINLDPRLIGQVYLNLLTNAVKYTPEGGEISVFISRKDDEIISQITDNGYGIPKAQQDRVFQKFFRAANAVKVETDGTGLGLYLIKAVVESSGGKIWFESEEGKGTTFWFSIPVSGMKAKAGEVTLDV